MRPRLVIEEWHSVFRLPDIGVTALARLSKHCPANRQPAHPAQERANRFVNDRQVGGAGSGPAEDPRRPKNRGGRHFRPTAICAR